MLYTVSNDETEIQNLLIQLKDKYGDYAFISYIDGEYGIRVWVYNSLVYNFYNEMKKKNKICIGIVFKNTKCFLNNLCDHIIEINDIEFLSNTLQDINVDNSWHSPNHKNNVVPSNSYCGNDGCDLVYIRGMHSKEYENVLLDMNFSDIFYTLHVDGSRFINSHGCNNGYMYKINNENIIYHNINNNTCFTHMNVVKPTIKRAKTNKIVIWIRNTNKWEYKNTKEDYYNCLLEYCIKNDKMCYVFQDVTPVTLPIHCNIIDCTSRIKNRPDFDNFINICSDSDIYIGSDSGPIYLLLHQNIDIVKICHDKLVAYVNDENTFNNINNTDNLISILDNYFS
jgi:hypothetical protein